MTSPRLIPLIAAALVAGCGSADTGGLQNGARPAPKGSGPLMVTPTDGRTGHATSATSEGLRGLAEPARIDADSVRRAVRKREGVGAGAACQNADVTPDASNLTVVRDATMCLVNGERQDAGLPVLGYNGTLEQSSVAHSLDMVGQAYFAHQSLDGRTLVDRIRAAGYIDDGVEWSVGENLAWGTGTLASPRSIVQAWMNSTGHRENILRNTFREAGLGIVVGNPSTADGTGATYTMNFGARGGAEATTAPVSAPAQTAETAPKSARKKKRSKRRKAKRSRTRKSRSARRSHR
jgi:uncharacterized protein YkwD